MSDRVFNQLLELYAEEAEITETNLKLIRKEQTKRVLITKKKEEPSPLKEASPFFIRVGIGLFAGFMFYDIIKSVFSSTK